MKPFVPNTFRHPKCYANSVGGCSRTLSDEHVIPENVLRSIGEEFYLVGPAWLERREAKLLHPKALASRILCKHHNELLSPLDQEIGRFFRYLHESFLQTRTDATIVYDGFESFDGITIERALLKMLAGLVAGGHLHANRRIPEAWVQCIAARASLLEPCGLYLLVPSRPGCIDTTYPFFAKPIYTQTAAVWGMIAVLRGLAFLLRVEPIQPPANFTITGRGVFRPSSLVFRGPAARMRSDLAWNQLKFQTQIELDLLAEGTVAPTTHFS